MKLRKSFFTLTLVSLLALTGCDDSGNSVTGPSNNGETGGETVLIDGTWYLTKMATTELGKQEFSSAAESNSIIRITESKFSVWKRGEDPVLEETQLTSNSAPVVAKVVNDLYPFASDSCTFVQGASELSVKFMKQDLVVGTFDFAPYSGATPPVEWTDTEPVSDTITLRTGVAQSGTMAPGDTLYYTISLRGNTNYSLRLMDVTAPLKMKLIPSKLPISITVTATPNENGNDSFDNPVDGKCLIKVYGTDETTDPVNFNMRIGS